MFRREFSFALFAVLVPGARALAHHSFGAFDMTREATVAGTVADYQWTNPHVWIQLNVVDPDGKVEEWGFETASPNVLGRRGWSKTMLEPGDKISITYHPSRDGGRGGAVISLTLPSGKTVVVQFA